MSVYCATKAAIRSFARCWIVDLQERKIRVSTLSPSAIDTLLLWSLGKDEEESKMLIAGWKAATPLDRIGTPDEMAKAVVFLAPDDSSYITGVEIFIDVGLSQI